MGESIIYQQVIEEINRIPENKLVGQIMKFAGSWNDMPDEIFNDFMEQINQRREMAFSRKNRN